jgi:NAD(P)-dependent dehydrogenase (short-subunit alcohol dehydrogenase family)
VNTQPLAGKVALITGANTGIGRETAVQLALQGAHVFLACRSEAKTRPVLDEINARSNGWAKAEFLALDLGDFDSIRHCAASFLARGLPLHLLINNAGLAGQKGITASGFELTFGVCHVGHFLLTNLLLDCLKASAPARIVVVASKAHRHVKGIDFNALRQPTSSVGGLHEYSVAKLANILFAAELARRLQGTGVTSYALHPGVVATDVWRAVPKFITMLLKRFMLSSEDGAATTLYCATSPACVSESGLYYDSQKPQQPSPAARNVELAQQLWHASEGWIRA